MGQRNPERAAASRKFPSGLDWATLIGPLPHEALQNFGLGAFSSMLNVRWLGEKWWYFH